MVEKESATEINRRQKYLREKSKCSLETSSGMSSSINESSQYTKS